MAIKRETRSIHITHEENMKYFKGKLYTWRHGFCYIQRSVVLCEDPVGFFEEYGVIKSPEGLIAVAEDFIIGLHDKRK